MNVGDFFDVQIQVKTTRTPNEEKGGLYMTYEPVRVMDGEEEVGRISPIVNGGIAVHVGEYSFYISPEALWRAVAVQVKK